jgi:hypothetical protein
MHPLPLWDDFVERRTALTDQMALSVCDGCNGCRHRCLDGFTVTQAEWQAAQDYLATLPDTVKHPILEQPKTFPWPGDDSGEATFTYCRFHDTETGMCLIYPVRPTVCRLFGHTEWLPCPMDAVPHIPEGSATLWNTYRTYERRTWDEWTLTSVPREPLSESAPSPPG